MTNRLLCGASFLAIFVVSVPAAMAQTAEPSGAKEPEKAGPQFDDIESGEPAATADADAIVVTGTRLQASGFTTPTPVTVIGQEDFQTRGAANIQDALSEVPAFRGISGSKQTTGGTYTVGQGLLDLRGLGSRRTLVLLDGRRHVPSNADGSVDTNVIPTALIERVDVVTGGASAAYGSDAVAGVVNFVLNDRLEGIKGMLQFGTSERSDGEEFLASFGGGTKFADGRGHLIVGVDYSHSRPAGTQYSRDWGREETALVALPASRAPGLPASYLADQQRIIAPPGSLVVSCVRADIRLAGAACPIGNLTFDDNGVPRPYIFGSPRGAFQMEGGDPGSYNQFRNQYLKVGGERLTGLVRLNYEFSEAVRGFAEFSAGRSVANSRTGDYVNGGTIVIQRDNPYIPDALASLMDANGISRFNLARLNYAQQDGIHVENKTSFWQASAGLSGRIAGDWKWDISYTHGQNRFWYRPRGITVLPNYLAALYVVRDATGNPVCGPTASNPMFAALSDAQRAAYASLVSPGCVPFNPFGPEAESQAAIDYVAPSTVESLTSYNLDTAGFNLAGSPFSTWAGDASLALGAEWRREKVSIRTDAATEALTRANAFFAGAPALPGQGSVTVKEAYIEVGLPLARDTPLFQALDLNGAARVTDYSSSGSVATWKAGVTWDIVEGVRIRATRSRDIRAPNVSEQYFRGNDFQLNATNPLTGLSNPVNSASIPNPGLKPEKADTWTAGLVLAPRFPPGLRLSADYYAITVNGVIGRLSQTSVVNRYFLGNRSDYAQFFTFDPSAPAGFTRVDPQLQNLNRQVVRGIDINLDYRVPIDRFGIPGALRLNAAGSHLQRFETFDDVGVSDGDLAGALPKWGWNAGINYRLGKFSTTLNMRYNSSVRYNILQTGPDSPDYDPASPTSVSKNIFPAATYFSLQAEYEIRDGLIFYGLVDNLFDKDPPRGSFAMLAGVGSTASSLYDPYDNVGRYFKIGVRFSL